MWLKQVEIRNFRNIRKLNLEFLEGINLVWGGNGQGKSNVLESIYCLLKGRSFRTRLERELLPWRLKSFEYLLVRGGLVKEESTHPITFALGEEGKKLTYDGKDVKKLTEYWLQNPVVVFSPDDLYFVKGGPAERRRLLDMELSQINGDYLECLRELYVVLRQRNGLLRSQQEEEAKVQQLAPLDERLIELGVGIYGWRVSFVGRLNQLLSEVAAPLFPWPELRLNYESFLEAEVPVSSEEAKRRYADLLVGVRDHELERGLSLVGPQRDEVQFCAAERDLRHFGSQAQQRLAMLCFRLALLELFRQEGEDYPVLLLDDAFSELDEERRAALLKSLSKFPQCLMTATHGGEILKLHPVARSFEITQGELAGMK